MKALTQAIKRIVRWLVLVVACFLVMDPKIRTSG